MLVMCVAWKVLKRTRFLKIEDRGPRHPCLRCRRSGAREEWASIRCGKLAQLAFFEALSGRTCSAAGASARATCQATPELAEDALLRQMVGEGV